MPAAATRESMLEDVKRLVSEHSIVLFLKGTADQPMCGFSSATVDVLRKLGKDFTDKNVLSSPEYRYVLSEHSGWPTIPQVFIGGAFVGGCDIVHELYRSGELQKLADTAATG